MIVDGIIAALGGRKAVAAALGVSRTAPYNWRTDGIPAHHWPDIVEIARARGIQWITFDVLRSTGRHARTRREHGVTKLRDCSPARNPDTSGQVRGGGKIETAAA